MKRLVSLLLVCVLCAALAVPAMAANAWAGNGDATFSVANTQTSDGINGPLGTAGVLVTSWSADGLAMYYMVRLGDTLASISANWYGSTKYANYIRRVNNVAFNRTNLRLVTGMTLTLPTYIGTTRILTAPVVGDNESLYRVSKGDTLASIALRFYGNSAYYREIWARNRDRLPDPNSIYVGQQIVLPWIPYNYYGQASVSYAPAVNP